MNSLREAAQQALEALEYHVEQTRPIHRTSEAITALRAALAESESFHPDWDRVEALQESLREHMAEIQRLRAALAEQAEPVLLECVTCGTVYADGVPPKVSVQEQPQTMTPKELLASIKRGEKWEVAEPVQEPVAKVELMTTGGNAGLATRIVEIDDHMRDRLRPGQLLYAAPPQRKPLLASEIVTMYDERPRGDSDMIAFARAIERAHGIGGSDE